MDKVGPRIEVAQIVDIPEILNLFNDFEDYLEKSISLAKHTGGCKSSVFSKDLVQNKFQCQFLKTCVNGDSVGIVLSSTSHLAGVGPILLLTLLYVKEQKRGFGKSLLFHAIRKAEKQLDGQIQQVHFLCNTENVSAWEFYKRFDARNLTRDTGFVICQFSLTGEVSRNGNRNINVRAAEASDLHQIVELLKELRETYSVSIWSEENFKDLNTSLLDNVYVAEVIKGNGGSEILGMVSFYFRYGMLSNYTPVIVGLIVKDGHRRSGIGTALVKQLSQMWTEQHGCTFANVLLPPDALSPSRSFFGHFPNVVNRTAEDTWNYCLFNRPSKMDL